MNSLEEIYINLGSNKLNIVSIFNIFGDTESKEDMLLRKVQVKDGNVNIKNDIIVDGIDDIKINLAACCKPIPGDNIVGYITKGNGISVHRMICPNISELEERIIDVKWNIIKDKKYSTSVMIRALKKENILLEIISKTSNNNINVQTINTYNNEDDTVFELTILVENKEKLEKFMNDIKIIPNIINVERIVK